MEQPTQNGWEQKALDREIFERELDRYVPDRVFDAHAHLYRQNDIAQGTVIRSLMAGGPQEVTLEQFRRHISWILPGRHVDGLFIPWPIRGDVASLNRFVQEQVRGAPDCRAELLITPDMDPDWIRQEVREHGLAGLKCYHVFAPGNPTWEAEIETYLPEAQVRVADREGMCITLHLVRSRALADASNLDTIHRYCQRYPNMKLILAHAGRGFNPHHTIMGVQHLKGLTNIWFDTSAITDCGALEAVMAAFGHERLLYGSDYFQSHIRGRCVAIGDSFLWLLDHMSDWKAFHAEVKPTLVGIESLRVLKLAIINQRLSDGQIEDIFWNNARRMLGIAD
ncbi:MAG: amidohydrolase family protein [Acidobacteria bacterium]|nr:amidohydrolase family protein [Acidobacteriota bacterium]